MLLILKITAEVLLSGKVADTQKVLLTEFPS